MDKGKGTSKWAWLPTAMPKVAEMLREKRAALGDAHVNECWKRGVIDGEPGWFFAREGPIALGTPWEDAELAAFAQLGPQWIGGVGSRRCEVSTPGQALVIIRTKGAAS